MWEMLFGPGLKAAGGVEGRDVEKDYYYETAVMLLALWGNAGLLICSLCCASCCELDVHIEQRSPDVNAELINTGDAGKESDSIIEPLLLKNISVEQ